MNNERVVIITGLSGSGKSCAARALEDEGFFVVDNLPLNLLQAFLDDSLREKRYSGLLAVVIDVRNRELLADFARVLDQARETGHQLDIVFFDAEEEVLIRRFSETRRRHPLTLTETIADGIALERELLTQLRDAATRIVDTSWMTPHQLRQQVVQLYGRHEAPLPLIVLLQSFGFRYGVPSGSDIVLDVRFLPNPHFVPDLQQQTGLDKPVRDFVMKNPVCKEFLQQLRGLLDFLLPQYRQEGKSYLTISIGCTGGRHRSVSIVEILSELLPAAGLQIDTLHRDIAKR
ncbi:MAG TPA: RNase adapter RapZ [Geothermobacteraceae bacterium]|nr:RNase adapter RapZ [Geothermobacteraceae bacterium]